MIFASITGILFGVRLKAPSLPGTPARLNFVKQSIFLLIQTSIRSLREKNLRYPKGVTINSSRSLFPRDQMVRYRCSLGCLMCSLQRRVIPWFEQILHVFQLAPDLNFRSCHQRGFIGHIVLTIEFITNMHRFHIFHFTQVAPPQDRTTKNLVYRLIQLIYAFAHKICYFHLWKFRK